MDTGYALFIADQQAKFEADMKELQNLRAKLAAAEKVIEAARELDGEHCFTEHGKFDCPIDTTKRAIAAYDALQGKEHK